MVTHTLHLVFTLFGVSCRDNFFRQLNSENSEVKNSPGKCGISEVCCPASSSSSRSGPGASNGITTTCSLICFMCLLVSCDQWKRAPAFFRVYRGWKHNPVMWGIIFINHYIWGSRIPIKQPEQWKVFFFSVAQVNIHDLKICAVVDQLPIFPYFVGDKLINPIGSGF